MYPAQVHYASGPGQEPVPPLPAADQSQQHQQQHPPLPSDSWEHQGAAAPPLPEEPPPLPQEPSAASAGPNSWAHGAGQQQVAGLRAAPAPAVPPWQQQAQQPAWGSAPAAYPGYAQTGYPPGGAYGQPPQQQQQGTPNPYAQMYGQAWGGGQQPGMHQHLHQGYGAPAYPAPGYANLYPATPYQAANGVAYPHAQQQRQPYGYQQQAPPWGGGPPVQQQLLYPQQQQPPPSWGHAAASNGHMPAVGASPAPLPPAQAAPQPSPERRPPAPANVTPIQAIIGQPGRASRPKRIAVVLRGLPGSGKSAGARRLRDAEVTAGAPAPRIHSIDDYFVTEVEKEVWEAGPDGKRRRQLVQATEYCYEADMEGVYKGSLLKAFRRTMEEARFAFVIVDADNARLEDFKPYWDAGQRAGYEVYILQMPEMSIQVCHSRNVHGRTLEEIEAVAARWEAVPPSMPQLDGAAWLRGGGKGQAGILEVDMEDDRALPAPRPDSAGDAEGAAASLSKASRWASFDDGDARAAKRAKRAQSAPTQRPQDVPSTLRGPGRRKSVRWADEAGDEDAGFSIGGAALRQLETVYVLEGLGPPKGGPAAPKSFAEQVKADHKSEQRNFRDILLGHARPF